MYRRIRRILRTSTFVHFIQFGAASYLNIRRILWRAYLRRSVHTKLFHPQPHFIRACENHVCVHVCVHMCECALTLRTLFGYQLTGTQSVVAGIMAGLLRVCWRVEKARKCV